MCLDDLGSFKFNDVQVQQRVIYELTVRALIVVP